MWIYCASALREHATDKLLEKVAAHRAELEKLNGGRAHRQGQE
jgi:hypothetical protein